VVNFDKKNFGSPEDGAKGVQDGVPEGSVWFLLHPDDLWRCAVCRLCGGPVDRPSDYGRQFVGQSACSTFQYGEKIPSVSVPNTTFQVILLLFMAHARAVFSDPGIVPLPKHRIDFSDSHSEGGSIAPKEDWTICTR